MDMPLTMIHRETACIGCFPVLILFSKELFFSKYDSLMGEP